MGEFICPDCQMDLEIIYKTQEQECDYDERDGKYHCGGKPRAEMRCGECGSIINVPKQRIIKEA